MNLFYKGKSATQPQARINAQPAVSPSLGSLVMFFLQMAACLSAILPLVVFAYLGTFSRYRADDYCETSRLLESGNFLQASATRYVEWTGRYSTLLFVQVSEWFGTSGMIYMTAVVLLTWLIGLTWMMAEIGKVSGLRWKGWLSFVLAALVIVFCLYRAPNLYQILFWRSGLVSYLAPLVPLAFVAAFILHQLPERSSRASEFWNGILVFVGVLIAGGASETIGALQISLLLICVLALSPWRKVLPRQAFPLLASALLGAVLSMLIMALAPGNLVRMDSSTLSMPDWFSLGAQSLTYAWQFIVDSFRVSPLPSLLAFSMPLLLFYNMQNSFFQFSPGLNKAPGWLLVLVPIGVFLVIAVSFAPTAYAQSFPSPRVRFPALFLWTLMLVAEGSLAGILLRQITSPSYSAVLRPLVLGLLISTFLYPMHVAVKYYDQVPAYRALAAAWDDRDQYIQQAVAAGAQDLIVVQLDTIGRVQEYKGNEFFWVNRCAAEYYGLRSLRAP